MTSPGRIVVLNGAPRSGKSSIVRAMQAWAPWINLGVDVVHEALPEALRPGIGLRPGGERPELEPLVLVLYAALYDSVAAHARLGLDVVVDVGHHDAYSRPFAILPDCARRLAGLPALLVGVRCPIETIMRRRRDGEAGREGRYLSAAENEPVPTPILAWQREVHRPGLYDLEVDTAILSAAACAEAIGRRLGEAAVHPTAFDRLARLDAAAFRDVSLRDASPDSG